MKLEFIALDRLAVSKANMRHGRKAPDVSDILPTVRTRGVLQPILVREAGEPGHYEIVAGRRRFHAARIVAAERAAASSTGSATSSADANTASTELPEGEAANLADPDDTGAPTPAVPAPSAAPLPDGPMLDMLACAVLDDADDAAAIEASLIENVARLDPDEVSRWECFTRLVKEGRSPEQIGQTFGLPDLAVRRVLALGNLLPRIRDLYRREEIDAVTVRHLTLASKSQQKAWLALVDDPDAWVPRGHQLKNWLFGGQSISVRHALFEVEASGLAIVTDLFGEDPLFVEAEAFWELQNAAIEARRTEYLAIGWPDAVVIGPSEHFHSWEYEKAPKRKGGKVFMDVRGNGEVIVHEGYLTGKEAARLARMRDGQNGSGSEGDAGSGTGGKGTGRAELAAATRGYVDLHRHAAVRAGLLERADVALRLMVAHAIAGSSLWRIGIEPQTSRNDAVCESVSESRAEALFDIRRRESLALLGCDPEDATLVGGTGWGLPERDLPALFARLTELSDAQVLEILGVVMGETLAAGSSAIESAGAEIGLAMSDWWEPDDAFFDGLRDREVLLAMLAEVAGSDIAQANVREKGATIKTIIRDHLSGNNGRVRRGKWVPRWMAFPQADYTARGIYAPGSRTDLSRSPEDADPADHGQTGPDPDSGAAPAAEADAEAGRDIEPVGSDQPEIVSDPASDTDGDGGGEIAAATDPDSSEDREDGENGGRPDGRNDSGLVGPRLAA